MKLLAAISHHGLGHLAQAAPVLNALHVLQPDLELTVWSGLSRAALQARLRIPLVHRAEAADVGLAMTDAMRVNVADSRAAYLAFHENWDARVADEAAWLKARGFDGVFSDVAYLPLAAAALAGIPAVALCSLNWRDIAGAYLAGHPDMAPLLERMRQAYQGARAFLCPTPAMPMAWLDNRAVVPPIMERGVDRRHELAQALEQHRDGRRPTRRVLVGFGGIGYRGMGRLPELPGVTWLAPDDWAENRPDLVAIGTTGMPFIDLLASCDALLTKVGYGGFVEAAAHGIPVLYVDRPDWPETPHLRDWLERHGNCGAIGEEELFNEEIGRRLEQLWALPARKAVVSDGARYAARRLKELLN
jgi:hypothetical protein